MNHSLSMESLLQAHHPFLVRLASSLIRDSHAADDMVQEVARRVLAADPDPAAIERPRSWLARILRHEVARESTRAGTGPRSVPGRDAPPAAARGLVDPAALALRAERSRVVSEELFKLGSADQEVLFLRFYDDLSVDRIAEALGLTRTAAQSRLTRAKERLAERLEARFGPGDEHGGWQQALLPLFSGAGGAGGAGELAGSSTLAKVWGPWMVACAAAVAALIAGVLMWGGHGRDPVAPLASRPDTALADGLGAGAVLQSAGATGRPVPVAPAPDPAQASSLAERSSVTYTLTDNAGRPVLGEPVTIAPYDAERGAIGQEIRGATDASGRFHFDGPGAEPYMIRTGREFRGHHALEAAGRGPRRSTSAKVGASARNLRIQVAPSMGLAPETVCTLWSIGSTIGAELPARCASFGAAAGLKGNVLDGRRFRVTAPGFAPSEVLKLDSATPRDSAGVRQLVFELEASAGAPLVGQVLGKGPGGSGPIALEGATVILESRDKPRQRWSVPHVIETGGEGRFASAFDLPFGAFRVEVHGRAHGTFRGTIQHGPKGTPLVIQLEQERVLRGRVQMDGEPVEYAVVQATLQGETFPKSWGGVEGAMGPRPYGWTDSDGRFEIRGLPAERVALFATGPLTDAYRNMTGRMEVPPLAGAGDGIEIAIGAAILVQGRVLGPDGAALEGIRVDAHHSGGFRDVGWAETDAGGAFTIRDFPDTAAVQPGEPLRLTALLQTKPESSYDRFLTELGVLETRAGAIDVELSVPEVPAANVSARGRVVVPQDLGTSLALENLELHFQSTSMFTGILRRSMNEETGEFRFASIAPGAYDLSLCREHDKAVVWVRSGIVLKSGDDIDFGDIVVGSAEGCGNVEIRVQDDSGARLDGLALGKGAVRLRMGDRMLSVHALDDGAAWRPEYPLSAGTWTARIEWSDYSAPAVQFVVREDATTQVVLTARPRR